jgi:hypothetical protein
MVSCFVTLAVAAALGQARLPEEAGWLKALPADAEVAIRIRGLDPARKDLLDMLNSMSPNAAATAEPAIAQMMQSVRQRLTDEVLPPDSPIVAIMRLPKPEDLQAPPAGQQGATPGPRLATLARIKDYQALQKSGLGLKGQPKITSQPGGYDMIKGDEGVAVYSFKGQGFVAVSDDEGFIKAIARPSGKTLADKMGTRLTSGLFAGDVGLYVDLLAVQQRYGDQIEEFRKQLMNGLEQAGGQGPAAGMMDMAKSMYGRLFDALKNGQGLALGFDFTTEGLALSGEATAKPDAPGAKALAGARAGTGELLAKLPDGATYYLYSNVTPESFEKLARMGAAALGGGADKESPSMKQAIESQKEAKVREVATATAAGDGMRTINVVTAADPKRMVEGWTAMFQAMKSPSPGAVNFIKDVKVTPNAQTYKAFNFNRVDMTIDIDKLAAVQPNNPGGVNAAKAMFGGDSLSTFYGTDGKLAISVVARSWEEARGQVDAVLAGQNGIGTSDGFKAVRSKLPEKIGSSVLISAQGLTQQIATQLATMMPGNAAPKLPGDIPKAPAYFGGAITASAGGYQFQFVAPNTVGPVFEKGLVPLFQGAGLPGNPPARVNQ